MSSNDNERAQSGDMIEITTHLRNDLGKRMQVSTSDGLSVVALDNRMRVTVAHGDYKVVRRCGRPATDDAPKRKVGRPNNAELAARAAAERTPPAVEVKAKVESLSSKYQVKVGEDSYIKGIGVAVNAGAVVTDADVAGLEAALYDVPVTRKAALTVDESKVTVESGDVSVEAAVELMTQEQIDTATENLRPLYGLTQEEFDAMTTHVEPRGFVAPERKYTHYFKDCPFDVVDVYRVLSLFNVTDPCLQHAIKKLLVAGGRGHKLIDHDIQETIDALERWQDMRDEEAAA